MSQLESIARERANQCAVRTGAPPVQTGSQSDSESWFVAAVRTICGKDAGLHLHRITGFPERSCYRYAAGDREPPADFLRALFRSPQGAPFLAAFMHGCEAGWWRDHQRAHDIGRDIIAKVERR